MNPNDTDTERQAQRRRQAERLAGQRPPIGQRSLSFAEVLRLVHELEVHQIELELQREELVQAKTEIETGLEKFEDLYDFAPVGYFTLDETGIVVSANLTGAAMLGQERGRLIERPFAMSVLPAAIPAFEAFLKEAIAGRGKRECEIALVKQGGGRFEAQLQALPVASPAGQARQCRVAALDITARKAAEAERQRLEEQVRQTQKLESLGIMAGGIAHDFNNLLAAILGNAELALAETPVFHPTRVSLEAIVKAAQCAADLTRQMLALSGGRRLKAEQLDLSELVAGLRRMLETVISKKTRLVCGFAERPLVVRAEASQIQQVFMNLLMNAAEAIGDREGSITVATSHRQCGRELLDRLAPDLSLPEGHYGCLEVADTGCGMSPATLARAFDPFFSTKFTGRGLGLAVVRGIVRDHRGFVEVLSEEGRGATFRVTLPAAEDRPRPMALALAPVQPWRGSGLALLVDDEPMVREAGQRLLERLGFSVITAADGCEALEAMAERGGEVVCVLLDLTMPRLDGRETLLELRRLRPELPVVICSGYDRERLKGLFSDAPASVAFLHKPYRLAELTEQLRVLLTPPSG